MALPSDSSSLLVPLSLDAWVVDAQAQYQQSVVQYQADYLKLREFKSPVEPPFAPVSEGSKRPAQGIHLHWALPDALTRAQQLPDGSFEFPFVPNRWLVVRCQTAASTWSLKAWVVQSDFLSSSASDQTGTSAYLDPYEPSQIDAESTSVAVNDRKVGRSYSAEAWETQRVAGTDKYFLQAVGPGNISFAAYKPFSENVFSFVDQAAELPKEATYTYLVVGWYAAGTTSADPLAGVNTFGKGPWKSREEWEALSAPERFNALLGTLGWSVRGEVPAAPPATSLYHGLVADVKWPYGASGSPAGKTQVAVGNTAPDALAALIQDYARQQKDDAWLTAGDTLSKLLQAAMFELLDDYGKPGGAALVRQQVEQSWFNSDPGGTIWQVVDASPADDSFDVDVSRLTPAQQAALHQQLSALNTAQQAYDQDQRTLQARQGELYRVWLKRSQAKTLSRYLRPTTIPDFGKVLRPVLEKNLYPDLKASVWALQQAQAAALAKLPPPTDAAGMAEWAAANWQFPGPETAGHEAGERSTLHELGLELKASTAARFWHAADPVLLISGPKRARKHGEGGRFNADNTLTCRLPGQTITGIQVFGEPAVSAQHVAGKVAFDQLATYTQLPSVAALLAEAFFSDPLNAGLLASSVRGSKDFEAALKSGLSDLLATGETPAPKPAKNPPAWLGTPPSPLAYRKWQQAWSPLFLEWQATYYPTVAGKQGPFEFSAWEFDGTSYTWNGQGVADDTRAAEALAVEGRTIVTPYAQNMLQAKLRKYLDNPAIVKVAKLEEMLEVVMSWDILAQRLSGFTDRLLTLQSQETFPPPPPAPPVPGKASPQLPDIGTLVGDHYHLTSVLGGDPDAAKKFFYPIRGGVVTFPANGLRLIDTFGQILNLAEVNTPQGGYEPLISPALRPPAGQTVAGITPFVLSPRLVQSTRLDLRLLANDSRQPTLTSGNPNPVCGWLLPNHLDHSLAVYDSAGTPLGELRPGPSATSWRPRPGGPGPAPLRAHPEGDIANATLRDVVKTLAGQPAAAFRDFLKVVDETLWTVDPLGGRADAFLSTLIGRPLAVVQLELALTLNGPPVTNQLWNTMLTPDSTQDAYQVVADTGGVASVPFPVRLGSLDLRNDGLMGYFQTSGPSPYNTFYAVHPVPPVANGAPFVQPILPGGATFQGDLALRANGPAEVVTLLLDPRGVVHGYSGILPVQTVAVPGHLTEEFLRKLLVNFQTGPILADPGPIRTFQPAEKHGTWSWLQQVGQTWEQDAIVEATDEARFPTQPPLLREGWLQLSGLPDGLD